MRGKLRITPQKKYAIWRNRQKEETKLKKKQTIVKWMLDMQVFWSKHQVNKREIEPEVDLANVAYELSSKGKKTSLTTKLPERWWFFFKKEKTNAFR